MNKVYKEISFRMSSKKMADVMYALIMCRADNTTFYSLAGMEYNRSQNAYNEANMLIRIPEKYIERFIELTGLELEEPQVVTGV